MAAPLGNLLVSGVLLTLLGLQVAAVPTGDRDASEESVTVTDGIILTAGAEDGSMHHTPAMVSDTETPPTLAAILSRRKAGCSYGGQLYAPGEMIKSTEPCLNCTCHPESLTITCHLRVCPTYPVPPPTGCFLVSRRGRCCSELICDTDINSVRRTQRRDEDIAEMDLSPNLESISLTDNEDQGSCSIGGTVYADGSAMLTSSRCQYCFCIRGRQRCVQPQCVLPEAGCLPRFRSLDSCCPSDYDCRSSTTREMATTTTTTTEKPNTDCVVNGTVHPEGSRLVDLARPCRSCFCLRGHVRCAPVQCSPALADCLPVMEPGKCCPVSYNCSVPPRSSAYSKEETHASESSHSERRPLQALQQFQPHNERPENFARSASPSGTAVGRGSVVAVDYGSIWPSPSPVTSSPLPASSRRRGPPAIFQVHVKSGGIKVSGPGLGKHAQEYTPGLLTARDVDAFSNEIGTRKRQLRRDPPELTVQAGFAFAGKPLTVGSVKAVAIEQDDETATAAVGSIQPVSIVDDHGTRGDGQLYGGEEVQSKEKGEGMEEAQISNNDVSGSSREIFKNTGGNIAKEDELVVQEDKGNQREKLDDGFKDRTREAESQQLLQEGSGFSAIPDTLNAEFQPLGDSDEIVSITTATGGVGGIPIEIQTPHHADVIQFSMGPIQPLTSDQVPPIPILADSEDERRIAEALAAASEEQGLSQEGSGGADADLSPDVTVTNIMKAVLSEIELRRTTIAASDMDVTTEPDILSDSAMKTVLKQQPDNDLSKINTSDTQDTYSIPTALHDEIEQDEGTKFNEERTDYSKQRSVTTTTEVVMTSDKPNSPKNNNDSVNKPEGEPFQKQYANENLMSTAGRNSDGKQEPNIESDKTEAKVDLQPKKTTNSTSTHLRKEHRGSAGIIITDTPNGAKETVSSENEMKTVKDKRTTVTPTLSTTTRAEELNEETTRMQEQVHSTVSLEPSTEPNLENEITNPPITTNMNIQTTTTTHPTTRRPAGLGFWAVLDLLRRRKRPLRRPPPKTTRAPARQKTTTTHIPETTEHTTISSKSITTSASQVPRDDQMMEERGTTEIPEQLAGSVNEKTPLMKKGNIKREQWKDKSSKETDVTSSKQAVSTTDQKSPPVGTNTIRIPESTAISISATTTPHSMVELLSRSTAHSMSSSTTSMPDGSNMVAQNTTAQASRINEEKQSQTTTESLPTTTEPVPSTSARLPTTREEAPTTGYPVFTTEETVPTTPRQRLALDVLEATRLDKHELPPALPNLRIIPFVAADAVVNRYQDYTEELSVHGISSRFGLSAADSAAQQSINADTCYLESRHYRHGETVYRPAEPCLRCRCYYGRVLCQRAECPAPAPGCRPALPPRSGSCCPQITCDGDEPEDDVQLPKSEPTAISTSMIITTSSPRSVTTPPPRFITTTNTPKPTRRIFLPLPTRRTFVASKNTRRPAIFPSKLTRKPTIDRRRIRPSPPRPAPNKASSASTASDHTSSSSTSSTPSSTGRPRPASGAVPPPPSVALDNLAFTRGAAAAASTSTEETLTGNKPDRRPIVPLFSLPDSLRYRPRPRFPPSRRPTRAPGLRPGIAAQRRPERRPEISTDKSLDETTERVPQAAYSPVPASKPQHTLTGIRKQDVVSDEKSKEFVRQRTELPETNQVVEFSTTELEAEEPVTLSPYQMSVETSSTTAPPGVSKPTAEETNNVSTGGDPFLSLFGALKLSGCNIFGRIYQLNTVVEELSGSCTTCRCTSSGVNCSSPKC